MDQKDVECSCKVGRSLSRYGLEEVHAEISLKREGGASLRTLSRFVNTRIVEAALERSNRDVIVDPDTAYRKLTGKDVSAGQRAEIESRLDRSGVDVDALQSNFVSHQTIRSHLQDCLGVDTSRESDLTLASAERTINWARSRQLAVVGDTLDRLATTDEFTLGSYDLTQTTRVTCQSCGRTATIDELLSDGGCDCPSRE